MTGRGEIEQPKDGFAEDLSLARAAGQGDRNARRAMANRLFPRIRTTARYLAGNPVDADDLVQVSLMEVLDSAHTYSGNGSLEGWADRIAVRTCMRSIKQARRRRAVVELSDEPEVLAQPGDASAAERLRVRRRLSQLLQRLSPDRRSVLVLQLVHGYSIEEISEMTEAPVNTVRDRLRTGRQQLRKLVLRDPLLRDTGEALA